MVTSLQQLLDRDERVVWSGQPRQGVMLRKEDLFLIPFFLIWTGIPTFGIAQLIGKGGFAANPFEVPFLIVPGIFVCIGLYMLIGRFFFDAWMRRRTNYAVTNKRAIIHVSGFRGTFRSHDLAKNAELELKERGDGTGTIVFGASDRSSFFQPRMRGWPGMNGLIFEFERIPEVTRVYGLIRQAQGR